MARGERVMVTLKELPVEDYIVSGHRMCAGCGPAIAARMALKAAGPNTIVVNATGCLEVATTIYPYTSWKIPWIHVAFENAAAVASGIEAAIKALTRKNLMKQQPNIIAFGGDGGTFDIGIQALSGALERGHRFLYICYDNEAYMNTGIQRSGATPLGAATTTSPPGKVIPGKKEWKKDLIGIAVAHGIPYAATACISYWSDYINKVKKALSFNGPTVIHVLSPCQLGWRFNSNETIKIGRLAVQTRIFPIYEVEYGKYRLNINVTKPLPVIEYIKTQGRFRHLLEPQNSYIIENIQKNVDLQWNRLLKLCSME
jgi:pyruvate ferredoxin oxidoreductase beta subunit